MIRFTIAALIVATISFTASLTAQTAPAPEQCLARSGDRSALTVTHGDKSYRMANAACRDQFVSDPERYAQLYDALLELEAEGVKLEPATPSLVPS